MAEASVSSKRKRKSLFISVEELPPQSPAAAAKSNKSPQQKPRVFSPDDSLALLDAFYKILKDSPSESTATTLLFNWIGKSLSGEITQTQMKEKLRKLRQKYIKQAGKPLIFKTPFDHEIFKMSAKIWGVNSAAIPEAKVDLWKKYSFLMEEAAQFPGNFDMKEGLKRLDETQLERLNNRWKLQQIKEAEMLVKKTELIQEQTKLILEAFQN